MSVTLSVPVRRNRAVGVKVTLMVQLKPGESDAGQLLLWAKSPLVVMPLIESAAVPVLDKVKLFVGLVVPTSWLPKFQLEGEMTAPGPMVWGLTVKVWLPESGGPARGSDRTVHVQETV